MRKPRYGFHRVASFTLSALLLFVARPRLDASQLTHWGSTPWLDQNALSGITNLVAVAAGGMHVLALDRQGKVYAWGDNVHGQSEVPPDLERVVAIAGGGYHSVALKADGNLVAWGRMSDGWSMQPASVPGGVSNVVSIACGFSHCVALRADGTLTAWNGAGVFALPSHWTNIVSISADLSRVAAVKSDGTAVYQDLGQGDAVLTGWSNVVQLAAANLIVGLRGGGTLLASGNGGYDPEGLLSQMTNVLSVSGSMDHGCILFGDGTLTNWGSFSSGQASVPPSGMSNISAVASGWAFDVALRGEGAPWIIEQPASRTVLGGAVTQLGVRASGEWPLTYEWRYKGSSIPNQTNAVLTLGTGTPLGEGTYEVVVRNTYGTVTSQSAHVLVPAAYVKVEPASLVTYQGASPSLTAEVTANAACAVQWQFNGLDLPGETNLTLTVSAIRRDQAGVYRLKVSNVYGSAVSLPLTVNVSTVAAWGLDMYGETRVPADLEDVIGLAAGGWHSLALTRNGRVRAWGNQADFTEPAALSNIVAIAAGQAQSLALQRDGMVAAWGGGVFGESSVPAGLSNVVAIGASIYNNLALRADGSVFAWGLDNGGQTYIPNRITNVVGIASGLYGGAALKADGTVDTWGSGDFGFSSIPADMSNVVAIACGQAHGLALKSDGTVETWGSALTLQGFVPAEVPPGLSNVVAISVASDNNLALRSDGTLVAWGPLNGSVFDPAYVPPGLQRVTDICAGTSFNLALVGEGPPSINMALVDRQLLGGRSATFYARATGAWPLRYQWQHAGTNLPGATGPSLLVTNLQSSDAGSHSLVVSNEFGTVASGQCSLKVLPCHASLQSSNIVTFPGGRAFLLGVVSGNQADAFQWRLAGEDVPGANSVSLLLTNVQFSETGVYTLVVSNLYGVVETAPCSLSLVPIAAWGENAGEALSVPPMPGSITRVAAGTGFSLALTSDGTVHYWGTTYYGLPNIPPDVTNVLALAAGNSHVLALKRDGTVRAWGVQSYAQATVPATVSNAVSVAAGLDHNLVARADGSVVAWGTTSYGVTKVPATLTNAIAVAAGRYHSSALRSDGTVISWGSNSYGQTNIPAGLKEVVAIAAGNDFTLALKADGSVVVWGQINNRVASVPVDLTNVVAIACGAMHCYALREDGSLLGWGGSSAARTNTPPEVKGVSDISSSSTHNLALIGSGPPQVMRPLMNLTARDGRTVVMSVFPTGARPFAYQWQLNGTNLDGATSPFLTLTNLQPSQAGLYSVVVSNTLGITVTSNTFLTVDGLRFTQQPTNSVARIAETVVFATVVEGVPPISYQWQFNGSDIPGATSNVLVLSNVTLASGGSYRVQASTPYNVMLSRTASLAVVPIVAWGSNGSGQRDVPISASNAVAIAAGADYSLALKADGTVIAWGDSTFGQGNVPTNLSNVTAIAAGSQHSLALRSDRTVLGWGRNLEQQCTIPPDLGDLVAIGAGGSHSLALKADGSVVAWGGNLSGQTNLPSDLRGAVAIACGENHSLAIREGGSVVAWGANTYGQTNVPPGITNAIAISGGLAHSVVVLADGTVVVWGNNTNWQLNKPTGLSGVFRACAGSLHNLALTRDRNVITWGWNLNGQANMPSNLSNCVAIAAGGAHSLALVAEDHGSIQPRLATGILLGNRFELKFRSEPGRVYRVECCDQFDATVNKWKAQPLVPGTGSLIEITDPDAPASQRFYRLRQW